MSSFEFISVLLSIVTSLSLAHLLTAIARMAQAKEMMVSFLLLGWMGLILFGCVDYWFSLWQARETEAWSLGYVGLWLLMSTMLYLAAWLVVPEGKLDGVDLPRFFDENRRKFLIPFAGAQLVGVLINSTLDAFRDLVDARTILWILPIVAAWWWSNRSVQIAALVATWAMVAQYAVGHLSAL